MHRLREPAPTVESRAVARSAAGSRPVSGAWSATGWACWTPGCRSAYWASAEDWPRLPRRFRQARQPRRKSALCGASRRSSTLASRRSSAALGRLAADASLAAHAMVVHPGALAGQPLRRRPLPDQPLPPCAALRRTAEHRRTGRALALALTSAQPAVLDRLRWAPSSKGPAADWRYLAAPRRRARPPEAGLALHRWIRSPEALHREMDPLCFRWGGLHCPHPRFRAADRSRERSRRRYPASAEVHGPAEGLCLALPRGQGNP